jgi:hypothetical protein
MAPPNASTYLVSFLSSTSPLIESDFLDPDGIKAAVSELESGLYREEHHSKLVEVITPDCAVRAFLS